MRFRNKYNINLFDNPLKQDSNSLEDKNRLEANWYDEESKVAFSQLNYGIDLMPMDSEFESWFAPFYDNPKLQYHYDRDWAFFSLFPRAGNFRFLELGCGNGCLSRFFIRRGIEVHSLDISMAYCRFIRLSDSRTEPARSCAEILPYKDNTFDIVTAFVALHHFNLNLCLYEIYRVLKPDGRAIFIEPLSNSRLLYTLRQLFPIKDNESPGGGGLHSKELALKLKSAGFEFEIEEYELFTRLERLPLIRHLQRGLRKFDYFIFTINPSLRRFARTAVIEIKKPSQ